MKAGDAHKLTDKEKRECAELVVFMLLSSSQVITRIKYNRETHDEEVMEKQVVPILHLNRFRPVVKSLVGMSARVHERSVLPILGGRTWFEDVPTFCTTSSQA